MEVEVEVVRGGCSYGWVSAPSTCPSVCVNNVYVLIDSNGERRRGEHRVTCKWAHIGRIGIDSVRDHDLTILLLSSHPHLPLTQHALYSLYSNWKLT